MPAALTVPVLLVKKNWGRYRVQGKGHNKGGFFLCRMGHIFLRRLSRCNKNSLGEEVQQGEQWGDLVNKCHSTEKKNYDLKKTWVRRRDQVLPTHPRNDGGPPMDFHGPWILQIYFHAQCSPQREGKSELLIFQPKPA